MSLKIYVLSALRATDFVGRADRLNPCGGSIATKNGSTY